MIAGIDGLRFSFSFTPRRAILAVDLLSAWNIAIVLR